MLNKYVSVFLTTILLILNVSCGAKNSCYLEGDPVPCGIAQDVLNYNASIIKSRTKTIEKDDVKEESLKAKETIIYQLPQSTSSIQTFSILPLNKEKNNLRVSIVDNKTYQEKYLNLQTPISHIPQSKEEEERQLAVVGTIDEKTIKNNTTQNTILPSFIDIPKVNTYVGENSIQFKEITTPIKEPVYAIIENISTTSQPVIVNFEEKKAEQIYYSTYSNNNNSLSFLKPSSTSTNTNNSTQSVYVPYSYSVQPIPDQNYSTTENATHSSALSESLSNITQNFSSSTPYKNLTYDQIKSKLFFKYSSNNGLLSPRYESERNKVIDAFSKVIWKNNANLGFAINGLRILPTQTSIDINNGTIQSKYTFTGYKISFYSPFSQSNDDNNGATSIIYCNGDDEAHILSGDIYKSYINYGGAYIVGFPTTNEIKEVINNKQVTYQSFKSKSDGIEKRQSLHYVNDIGHTYFFKSGILSTWTLNKNYEKLGNPTSDEVQTNYGVKQTFENGEIQVDHTGSIVVIGGLAIFGDGRTLEGNNWYNYNDSPKRNTLNPFQYDELRDIITKYSYLPFDSSVNFRSYISEGETLSFDVPTNSIGSRYIISVISNNAVDDIEISANDNFGEYEEEVEGNKHYIYYEANSNNSTLQINITGNKTTSFIFDQVIFFNDNSGAREIPAFESLDFISNFVLVGGIVKFGVVGLVKGVKTAATFSMEFFSSLAEKDLTRKALLETAEFAVKKLTSNDLGRLGEKWLVGQFGGGKLNEKVTYIWKGVRKTAYRYVDNFTNGIARESKVGYKTLTSFHKEQIAKDSQLLKDGIVDKVEWYFFKSPQTGKFGASQNLKDALRDNGIKYIELDFKL